MFVSTSTVEGFLSRIKRSHMGVHQSISKKHRRRCVMEAVFKDNIRKVTDGQGMVKATQGAAGKRLMYRKPVKRKDASI